MNRIRGLDSIRAVLALWVAMNHVIKPPLPAVLATSAGIGRVLKVAYDLSINGRTSKPITTGQHTTLRVTFRRTGHYEYRDSLPHHAQWGERGGFAIT